MVMMAMMVTMVMMVMMVMMVTMVMMVMMVMMVTMVMMMMMVMEMVKQDHVLEEGGRLDVGGGRVPWVEARVRCLQAVPLLTAVLWMSG